MDSYQAIYDAVRSKIGNGDIGSAVNAAMRDANISHYADMAGNAVICAAAEHERPSVLFRPKVFIDANQWCALYGDDLQSGVAGFGDSPSKAMWDFDRNWQKNLPEKSLQQEIKTMYSFVEIQHAWNECGAVGDFTEFMANLGAKPNVGE